MSQKQPKGIIKRILGIAIPAITCAAVTLYIGSAATLDVAVRASFNGEVLGFVKSSDDIALAKSNVLECISEATDGGYNPDINIEYELVNTRNPEFLSSENVRDAIWSHYSDKFCEAYMLYIDGHQVAAHKSEAELSNLISNIENALFASGKSKFDGVEITSGISIEKQLCQKSMLRSIDEINELINPLAQSDIQNEAPAEASSALITTKIGALTVAAPEIIEDLSPSIDSIMADTFAPDLTLNYNFVDTETVSEVIPHTTQKIEDYNKFVGDDKLITEGSDGEMSVTYKISYDASGNVTAREVISQTVITPATDTVIKVGARPIPPPGPTGTFMWPCAAPKGISSPYGPRVIYGKSEFHLGIDIPDVKGSPIYASDGGTVIWASYTPSYGNSVRIAHANGYETLYAHLDTMVVKVGDVIRQGQLIATMGTTGVSYGTHLHFEVRINHETQDPEKYLPELPIE